MQINIETREVCYYYSLSFISQGSCSSFFVVLIGEKKPEESRA